MPMAHPANTLQRRWPVLKITTRKPTKTSSTWHSKAFMTDFRRSSRRSKNLCKARWTSHRCSTQLPKFRIPLCAPLRRWLLKNWISRLHRGNKVLIRSKIEFHKCRNKTSRILHSTKTWSKTLESPNQAPKTVRTHWRLLNSQITDPFCRRWPSLPSR